MSRRQEVDYTVVLTFPGFGEERENAEAVVEAALEWLNNNKEEPGFRFAPPVSATWRSWRAPTRPAPASRRTTAWRWSCCTTSTRRSGTTCSATVRSGGSRRASPWTASGAPPAGKGRGR